MDIADVPNLIHSAIMRYCIHILVFLFVLFIGLTFAHPAIVINDGWITVNQLHQLHDGHQIIINEGKYGLYENGTLTEYFAARANVLGYSLFLPLISLLSLWLIDLFGEYFVFLILSLWTIVALVFILILHFYFRKFATIGNWCWTPTVIGLILVLYFINLFYFIPFPVTGPGSFPEVMAIVFTNIVLLAFAGTLLYEINLTLFDDSSFSVFGTIVCLFSSSYFFWTTGCKDHILVLLLFIGTLLSLVKFQKTREPWFLPLAFLFTGLLAWARPELALWVFLFVCALWGYTFIGQLQNKSLREYIFFTCSPLFTVFGALPFFLNNYLITKNPVIPTGAIYLPGGSAELYVQTSPYLLQSGAISGPSVYQILSLKRMVPSSNLAGDFFGVLFYPFNGSIGVLSLTPLFLLMVILAIILLLSGKLRLSREEKSRMAVIALLALSVFLAYANDLHGLNVSRGITPDIRYLSPLYIPLTLIGLIILKKIQIISENPVNTLKKMLVICALGIPLSLVLMSEAYTNPDVATGLNAPIAVFFSISLLSLILITFLISVWNLFTGCKYNIFVVLIALLCSIPLIWQIDASVYVWQFATAEGYPAWIPVIRILYTLFSFPLAAH